MRPTSDLYRQALARPHQVAFHVTSTDIAGVPLTVDSLGAPLLRDIPVSKGSVTASMTNRVTRTASLTVTDDWYPRTPSSAFAPEAAVIRISAGMRYGDGTEEVFQIFTGRVYDVTRTEAGEVTVQCDDFAADVIGCQLEQIWTVRNRGSVLAEIRALIRDALPSATFTAGDAVDAPVPELNWDKDRGSALDNLAQALGARWYALGDGSFTVQRLPYVIGTPALTLADGPGGTISAARISRSRDGVANSVTVVSERTDGTNPVRSTSRNTASGSPTRYGDRFGRVAQVINVQTPLTQAEAKTLSLAQLGASIGLTEQWDVSCVPDYSLEPGDALRYIVSGTGTNGRLMGDQILDRVTYPLDTTTAQSLSGRGPVPPDTLT
ncbi:DUF5047 domain-containing protein [Streptomyces sp. NPDC087525]|uniref:DUF5047 domain-containing protein n=1 Tax=Streptomyces sp. NPDC087525 TaxID=3365793 RepID=UPI00381A3436